MNSKFYAPTNQENLLLEKDLMPNRFVSELKSRNNGKSILRLILLAFMLLNFNSIANAQLTVVDDPICMTNCCSATQPCNCRAGVSISGGIPPYTVVVTNGTGIVGNSACLGNLCPGTYTFEVRDVTNQTVFHSVTVGGNCCKLLCRDTTICFSLPDSLVICPRPTYADTSQTGGAGTGGNGGPLGCAYDSIWSFPPPVFPVGTTVVTWYVRLLNGQIDSCTQNIIRRPPSVYNISFTTSPPIVGGVINICNGTSITFNDNSTGITGLLWNFGNGYYSSNANHTEPAIHYPPGTYYDTLTVFDDCGNPHDTAFQVVVDSASGPDITCISVVCPGDTVTYHTNANCTNYTWGVSGGFFFPPPSPTSDSVTVVWGPGPHGTISLSVSGCTPPSTCAVATIKTIDIVPATLPIAGDTVICAGSTVTYCIECFPGNEHSWEMLPANAGTITGQNTCCVTVAFNPNFFGTVSLVVNYHNVLTGTGCNLPSNCEHDPGCGGSGTINITVLPIFGINGPAKVCPNVTSSPFNGMNLTNNTIAPGVSWQLVTPANAVIPFANSASLNAYTWNAGPGNYQLTAYAPPGIYCNDSAIVTVQVVDVLTPNIIDGPDTVCAGQPYFFSTIPNMTGVTYTWNVSGGVVNPPINGSSVSITWGPGGGTVSVYQTLTAAPGCVSSTSAVKVVNTWPNFPLPVITASSPTVCLKGSITYSIPTPLISNGSYTWSVVPATAGNIMTANGTNTITIQWVNAAITPIYVKLKISRCYTDSVMLPVTLLPLPAVPSISYLPTDPCVNDVVAFTTTSPGPIYNWSFGDAGTATIQNPTHAYTNAGDFTIQLYVTNTQGCSDTAYSKIHVDTVPVLPVITGANNVCLNTTVGYGFSEPLFTGAAYTWSLSGSPKGIVQSSGLNFINIKWTVPGVDTLYLHVQSTCLDTLLKYTITVNALPTAGIGLPSPSCIGAPLSFTGSGGVSYAWSFAGGSPSSSVLQNPTVTYSVPGNFAVALTVTDANGCVGTTTTTLAVHDLPLAIITGPYQICSFPATVNMTAVNLAGYSFAWSNGGTTSAISPVVTVPTTYNVIVTNAFGCTQTSNSLTVVDGFCGGLVVPGICTPRDTIDYTKSSPICLSQTYTSVGTATLVGWDFGDGGTAGAVSPVTHTFPVPGIYTVTVYGASVGIDTSGSLCFDTIYKYHNVTIPFDVHFDYNFNCNGGPTMKVNFSNTSLWLGSAASYNWTWFDVTTSTLLSSSPFPSPSALSPGVHVISVTAFDPITGATCTETKTLNVPAPIVAAFNVTGPVCQGTAATFTDISFNIANENSLLFNNGNGATGNTNPSNLIYTNAPGPFTATLTVTDIYGCSSTASQSVTVLPAGTGTITVGPNTCDSVQLTASGPGPFTWSVISPPPFPSNPVYVKTNGFYSVTGIGGNGCPYKAGPIQVTVKHSPVATISGKTNYCQGETLDLKTSSAGTSFVWQQLVPFAGVVGTNAPNLNIPAITPGTITYSVTITGANGCSSSASYTVIVDPVPSSATIVASGPLTFCEGDSVKLSVVPVGATYLWSKTPTPALTPPTNTNSNIYVTVSGTYSVIVQTINGCPFPAIAPVTVTVNPKPVANITGDTVLCEGEQLTLNTTPVGGGTYLWNGPAATGNTNPFVKTNMQLTDAGLYSVVVTNSYGCTQTDTITVVVNPAPVTPFITSNPGGVLCEGLLVTFTATPIPVPPVVYTWSTGQNGVSITAAMQGNYYVVATNQFGCSATSNTLTIHPLPDLSCVPSGCYDFCNDCDSVTIPGPVGFASYTWQQLIAGNFVFYSATQNLTVLPPGGIFRLLAANSWGCADSSDTLKIDFHDCCQPDTHIIACVDTTCQDFSDNLLHNFTPYPLAPNVITNVNNVGGQYAGDIFVQATDLAGPSGVQVDSAFLGKWCCGKFSYDFKIINDGVPGTLNVAPKFRIFNSALNKGFLFTASFTVNENSPWTKVIACGGLDSLPVNTTQGTWTPIAPAVISDWQAVASNVTDVVIATQISSTGEVVGIDNVCYTPQQFTISCKKTKVCGGYIVSADISDTSACNTFHYQWSNGSTEPFLELPPPGTYCVTISNCCGCIDSCCITVPPDTNVIVVTDTVYHINCDSLYGAITMNVTGGVPPYTYLWNTGATTKNVDQLTAGVYNVIITDSVGCIKIVHDTVTVQGDCNCNSIPPPPPPTLSIIAVTPDSCNKGGCIQLAATGCCIRYSYTYHGLCNSNIIDSVGPTKDSTIFCHLNAGYYTIYITDPCGNVASQTVLVPSAAPPLLVFVSYSNCGQSVCVGAEGGCGPYTYEWSNGETTHCLTSIIPCTSYTVTVTDAYGCSQTVTVNPPHVDFTAVQPTCCDANGAINATVCFGPQPYTYLWSNGGISAGISAVPAGTYCLTVTNALGQQFTCCYTLQSGTPNVPDVHFNVSGCGSIVTAVIDSGACGGYTYHWENNSTELFHEGVHPCDSITFTIVACDGSVYHHGLRVPGIFGQITPVDCHTGLGAICVTTECMRCEPLQYNWTPVIAGNPSDSNCIQVPTGHYTLCITNSCGDVICCDFYMPPMDSTEIIIVTDTVYNIDCDHPNGGIDVVTTGGHPPYQWTWSNGATTESIASLAAGAYTLVVTDSVGCETIVHDTVVVNNSCNCNGPEAILPHINIISIDPDECNGHGCIHATFTGCCLWYSYTYIHPCNPLLSYSVAQTRDSSIFCNLNAGTYTIFVQDGCGNMVQQTVVVPSINPPLTAIAHYNQCGQGVCVVPSGGCPPYSYLWLGGNTTECITGSPCTSTYVTITDSRGCSITIDVYPPAFNFNNVVEPTCCLANGSICPTICFGPTPYTYSWSNGATTQCLTGVPAGTYCLTVTNRDGNQVTCCYTLNNAAVQEPTVHFTFSNCGNVVSAQLGEMNCENVSWHWENQSTSLVRPNLTACDSITLTIVTCDGVEHHHGFRVPSITAQISPVDCHTGLGTICVTTECFRCEPYQYTWTPTIAGTQMNSNCVQVPSGHYTVCVTNSCGDVICCDVFLPPLDSSQIIVVTDTVYNIDCDHPNGGIDVVTTGGHPPYQWSWSNGATTESIASLAAGAYTLTVTDSVGCETIIHDTVVVNNNCNCSGPNAILPSITILEIEPDRCDGHGCIHATFTGCCLWYSYTFIHPCNPLLSYSVAQTRDSSIFCNLAAGTYTIFVQDGCGNLVQQTVTVPSINPPLTALVQYNQCGQGACVIASGGCPPYSYLWLGGNTTECATGSPCTSTYVTITDSRGCSITVYVYPASFDFSESVQPVCCNSSGSICPTVCFGPTPYTYSWSNGATTRCISEVPAGNYCLTVTNADGQQVTCCYTLTVSIPEPVVHFTFSNCGNQVAAQLAQGGCISSWYWENQSTSLTRGNLTACDSITLTVVTCDGALHHFGRRVPNIQASITPVNCATGLGAICIDVSCFPCPPYSYEWSTTVTQVNNNCFVLPPGEHHLCITNACGDVYCCDYFLPNVLPIQVSATVVDVQCYGLTNGSVTVSASNGTAPYQGVGTFNVGAGTYTYTVVDANGCSGSVTVHVNQPAPLVVHVTHTPINCYGGTSEVTITAEGGTGPYTGVGTVIATAGEYFYVIIDANGCVGTASVLITQPPKVEGTIAILPATCGFNNGSATVTPSGGTPGYTYSWSPGGQTTSTIQGLAPGIYTVTITDSHGCTGTATAIIPLLGEGPATPGAITGPKSVCRNTTGIVYSVAPVPGATSYIWTLPSGCTGTSTTNSISLSFSNAFTGGFICVSAVNPCGVSPLSCMNISVMATSPSVPTPIVGPVIVCGPTTVTYSTSSTNALSYVWTVAGGASIITGQGTNTITVNIPAGFGQGSVQVYAVNCVGNSAVRGLLITGIPTHGYGVTGPLYVCANSSGTYSMPVVTGATSYVWSVTGNATLGTNTLSATTTTQVINFGPGWTSGTVSVSAVNACGSYTKSFVVRSVPIQPGGITGPGTGLCNTTATYSIAAVAGATSYLWTVPAGVSIIGSATGTSVNVQFTAAFNSNSANICVSGVNSCGVGPARCFTITSRPPSPVVNGPLSVCKTQSAVVYSVAPVAGATSYTWQVTGGATIIPAGTSATVNFNTATLSSLIVRCFANNACGSSAPGLLNVAVSLTCRTSNADGMATSDLIAYPNPTDGKLNIGFTSTVNSAYRIKITNVIGMTLYDEESEAVKGSNLRELDLGNFAKGIYFLSVDGEGVNATTIRIVIQ